MLPENNLCAVLSCHVSYMDASFDFNQVRKLQCDRVMTVSFHKHGDMFFPGTGDVKVVN